MVAGRHPPGYPVNIQPSAEDIRRAHQAEQYRLDRIETERRRIEAEQKQRDAEAAAMVERVGKSTH